LEAGRGKLEVFLIELLTPDSPPLFFFGWKLEVGSGKWEDFFE
jgi:hypothetical protein